MQKELQSENAGLNAQLEEMRLNLEKSSLIIEGKQEEIVLALTLGRNEETKRDGTC